MIHTKLITATIFLYLGCSVLYGIFFAFRSHRLGRIATRATAFSWVLHTGGILIRWWESYQLGMGRIPLTNLYESLVFFSWCIVLLYLLWEWKLGFKSLGALVLPLAFFFIAYASLGSDRIDPLIPALQSNWLHIHVISCFLSYASFAISCGASILYLWRSSAGAQAPAEPNPASRFPSSESLDALIYQTIAMGFSLLTIGIVTGSAWASYAWGAYWSWDPKETWSLITWLVYAIFLHARLVREWRGKKTAILAIVGFGSVLFTYFGVNFWLSGLHSYV